MMQQRREKQTADITTKDQRDTYDTRCAWLTFLENAALGMFRLRSLCLAPSRITRDPQLDCAIDSTYTAIEETAKLQSRLMDMWGINLDSLSHWMNSGSAESEKNMGKSNSTASLSQGSPNGQTKKSRKR